ncbi:hypothetical protein KJK38_00075 [Bacillus velezensis]|nr:hypothetical protein [Bacillus velezensis]MBT0952027.1 hypothetical protein [Bacillus velezensis]
MEVGFNGKNLDDLCIKTAKGDEGMTKIHVLADETLGGIKREYVEVDRKAEVGDTVLVTKMEGEDVSQIAKVIDDDYNYEIVQLDRAINGEDLVCTRHDSEDVIVLLEPTDIVHIDGQRYEMVDRKAEVGEKVMYVDESGESYGIVTEVLAVGAGVVDVAEYEEPSGAVIVGFSHDRYRVLVPIEAAEDEPKPADPIDVIASLAQEVSALKRTVNRHRDEIDTLYKDKRTLGEELARLAAEVGKEPESSAKVMAEAFVALRRAGL